MIVLLALFGVLAGWLVSIAGDILIRYSSTPIPRPATTARPPALWRLARQPNDRANRVEALLEVVSGAAFAAIYALHGDTVETVWLLLIYAFFALITIMDYKYRVVLNILTYPGVVIALVINVVVLRQPILPILLGMFFAFGVFYLTAMLRPGGLGGGDIKLATLMGAAFGFPTVLWALIVSAAASAIAIIGMLTVRRGAKRSIPYAPFLCLGTVIILIFSPVLPLP